MRSQATVNGEAIEFAVEARVSLADALRDELELTGTHLGCEHGVCGACTVLVDGEPARSCLMLAAQADGTAITTIEGLAEFDSDGVPVTLHPVQQAMYDSISFQCAFCSPGFILTTVALLAENPDPTEAEIREQLGWQHLPLHRLPVDRRRREGSCRGHPPIEPIVDSACNRTRRRVGTGRVGRGP